MSRGSRRGSAVAATSARVGSASAVLRKVVPQAAPRVTASQAAMYALTSIDARFSSAATAFGSVSARRPSAAIDCGDASSASQAMSCLASASPTVFGLHAARPSDRPESHEEEGFSPEACDSACSHRGPAYRGQSANTRKRWDGSSPSGILERPCESSSVAEPASSGVRSS